MAVASPAPAAAAPPALPQLAPAQLRSVEAGEAWVRLKAALEIATTEFDVALVLGGLAEHGDHFPSGTKSEVIAACRQLRERQPEAWTDAVKTSFGALLKKL